MLERAIGAEILRGSLSVHPSAAFRYIRGDLSGVVTSITTPCLVLDYALISSAGVLAPPGVRCLDPILSLAKPIMTPLCQRMIHELTIRALTENTLLEFPPPTPR